MRTLTEERAITPSDPSERRAVLVEARAMVAGGWCQGVGARDERGESIMVRDEAAVCFCMTASVDRAQAARYGAFGFSLKYRDPYRAQYNTAMRDLCREAGTVDLPKWNDEPGRNVQQVLTVFDRAIERLPLGE